MASPMGHASLTSGPLAVPPFPETGIALAGIQAFIRACGGPAALAGLSTTQVCDTYIKPATAACSASFCQMAEGDLPGAGFLSQGHFGAPAPSTGMPHVSQPVITSGAIDTASPSAYVAPATVFISHAWKQPFLDTVGAIEAWVASQGTPAPTYFWFDVFSNSQWDTGSRPFEWWCTTFRSNIQRLGHTLLVLEYEDPKPLTRAWCLWEIYATIAAGSQLTVIMSTEQHSKFAVELVHDLEGIVRRICSVDVSKADAFLPSDRDAIMDAVQSNAGFHAVNSTVTAAMRQWMIDAGRRAVDACVNGDERVTGRLLLAYAKLLGEHGRLQEAAPLMHEVMAGRRRLLGDMHRDTLAAIHVCASRASDEGKLAEAEILVLEALQGRKAVLGQDHADTLSTASNYAILLKQLGRMAEAKTLFKSIYDTRHRVFGEDSTDTIVSMNNYATILTDMHEYAEAQQVYASALKLYTRVIGATHPATLGCMSNYAEALLQMGEMPTCEQIVQQAMQGLTRVYGADHAKTLAAQAVYGQLLLKQGHVEAAAAMMEDCMRRSMRSLGDHTDTCMRMSAYAHVLQRLTRVEEAEALRRQECEMATRLFGLHHNDTLAAISNLGILLAEGGRIEEAVPLFKSACEGYRAVKGDMHITTLNSINNYAGALLQVDDVKQALELYQEALAGFRVTAGKEHPDTLFAMCNYAKLLQDADDLEEAEPLYRELLAAYRRCRHPETRDTVVTLARLLLRLQKMDEAIGLFLEAIPLLKADLGERQEEVLECLSALSTAYALSGQPHAAYECLHEVLQAHRLDLGEDAPETIQSMFNCARVLADQGKFPESLTLLTDTHGRAKRVLGPQHEFTQCVATVAKQVQAIQTKSSDGDEDT